MSNDTLTREQYDKAVSDTGQRSPSIAIAAVGALLAHDAAQRAEIERLRASLATARREALEDAALALDAIPAVSQNVELALHMARHAIRTLKCRTQRGGAEARGRGEGGE